MTAPEARLRTAQVLLALCLLLVEFLAAMQSFVTGVIMPMMAEELAAQRWYGVVAGGTQIALFLTMPLGAALRSRWSAARLLSALTPVVVLGGVVSALAPTIEVFLLGRVVGSLAAGALMGVSLGALVSSLPSRWRRLVLGGYAATWVIAGLLGPLYAGWVSEAAGWRWALVGYLPLLWMVRWVLARQLRILDRHQSSRPEPLRWGTATVLAVGIGLTSAASWPHPLTFTLAAAGVLLALMATARTLPPGVFRLQPGRPGWIGVMGLLAAPYFGAHAVVTVVAHDLLGRRPAELAVLLALGAVPWSVVGLYTGRRPPSSAVSLRRRVALGASLQAAGLVVMTLSMVDLATSGTADAATLAWPALLMGWMIVGTGMGCAYLDTLDRILAPADAPADGPDDELVTGRPVAVVEPSGDVGGEQDAAATGAVVVESVSMAVIGTITATALAVSLTAGGFASGQPASPTGVLAAGCGFAVLALIALSILPALRRVEPVPPMPGAQTGSVGRVG